MSWESSMEYYRLINEGVKNRLGGFHSAKLIMYSVDFEEIERLQHQGDWEKLTSIMTGAASSLAGAGAELLLICTNTMHKMADETERAAGVPLLHIADAAAAAIKKQGLSKAGLLGTRFTMEQDFYRGRFLDRHGISTIIPDSADMDIVHDIIFNELCLGKVNDSSRKEYVRIINRLAKAGAEGIVLGCTEIPMLISQKDVQLPVFNTTELHAAAAVDASVGSAE